MITVFGKRIRLFRPKSIWIRKVVQWAFFILIALIAVNHTLAESGASIPLLANASLHAVCPFGGVETLYQFVAVGTFVQKIHQSSFVLMMISLLLAILFGPVFCGWVCPLGTYSSIFNASPILVVWEKREWRTWFRRQTPVTVQQSRP